MQNGIRIESLGDAGLLITIGREADIAAAERVRRLSEAMRRKRLEGVRDIVPSYCTIGVHFDAVTLGGGARERVREWIESCGGVRGGAVDVKRREIVIPVCHGGEFGPDLAEMSVRLGLSEREIIALHSGGTYEVRAVGFMPGFGYLAGLPERLASARRSTPRTRVAAGSVGIAGMQTGVYPLESPGGWQLIGRTPLRMFRPEAERASLLSVGEVVRFLPIDAAEFRASEGGRR